MTITTSASVYLWAHGLLFLGAVALYALWRPDDEDEPA